MSTAHETALQEINDLPLPETTLELLDRMQTASEAARALFAAYDEPALTRPLSESGWSAKDYIAHLMIWEYSLVALLQKKTRYEEMGLTKELVAGGDFDEQNDSLYKQHKDRPLAEILQAFHDNHNQLVELVSALTDSDLQKPYIQYQPTAEEIVAGDYVNNPIIGWLVGDTYSHYAEHILDLGRLLEA